MSNLIDKIEKRAIISLKWKAFAGKPIFDPYMAYHDGDSDLWLELLSNAAALNEEIYSILFILRGGGTRLVPHAKFGYVLEPIIGDYAWESIEQYNQEKEYLNIHEYLVEIINLLKELKHE